MPYYFFIPGINTNTADIDGWHDRAERYCERLGLRANAYPYHVTALDRWIHQAGHIRNAMRCLREGVMPDERIAVTTHSNGAAIACGMLREYHDWHVSELHLVAGAEFASYEQNGLNAAVDRGQVKAIFLYCSRSDRALKAAKATRKVLRFVGLGFGSIGLTGPADMSDEADARTRVVWRDGFDHSDYFTPAENFESTMRLIAA